VKNFSDHGIPLSHVVVENYYDSGHRLDPTRFTTPAALVEACGEYGAKVVLWLDPHVHKTGAVLGDALQKAGCASSEWADTGGCGCSGPAACGYSDLSLAKCQQVWASDVKSTFMDAGIAGFKLDQDDGGVVLFRDNNSFPGGATGGATHNVYGYQFSKMFHDM
jgi:alpha-glucosidase (family GH31 glycosyl hydrolase)